MIILMRYYASYNSSIDTNIIKIGIQIRTGDMNMADGAANVGVNSSHRWENFFECADYLGNTLLLIAYDISPELQPALLSSRTY